MWAIVPVHIIMACLHILQVQFVKGDSQLFVSISMGKACSLFDQYKPRIRVQNRYTFLAMMSRVMQSNVM